MTANESSFCDRRNRRPLVPDYRRRLHRRIRRRVCARVSAAGEGKIHSVRLASEFRGRLPVSKPTFERMTAATAAAMRVPDVSATTRARLDTLAGLRKTFVAVYRTVMIAVGLAGLMGAVFLLRSHTPGNMNGLPGGIILLLSLGALLNGLIPGPSIKPVELLDKDLRDQNRNKINVQVTPGAPLTRAVTESQLGRAAEMIRQCVSPEDAARAVVAANGSLSEADQQAIAAAVAHFLRRNP